MTAPILHTVLATLALSLTTSAQSTSILVERGDPVAGPGSVFNVDNQWIRNDGTWYVRGERTTDGHYAFENGVDIDAQGSVADWSFDEEGARAQVIDSSGLHWNGVPLSSADLGNALGLAGMIETVAFQLNGPGRLAVMLRVRPPGSPDFFLGDPVVAILDLDDTGTIVGAQIVAMAGTPIPNVGDLTAYPAFPSPHSLAFNANGTLLWGALTDGSMAIVRGTNEALAYPGLAFSNPNDPAIDGRTISSLFRHEVDVNDLEDYAFTCILDPSDPNSDYLIVKNGEKFVQEGDVLPSLGGAMIGGQHNAPLYVANSGDLFWGALLENTPDAEDRVWMRNREPIVRKGQTMIDGRLVSQLGLVRNGFHVSRDGRFWVGQVSLTGSGEAAVFVDFGAVVPIPGAGTNTATMRLAQGQPYPGNALIFELDGGQAPGVQSAFLLSDLPAIPGSPFGIPTPFGELLIGRLQFAMLGTIWTGSPAFVAAVIPNNLNLVDSTWYSQGVFIDVGNMLPEEDFRLTNGLRIEVGAP